MKKIALLLPFVLLSLVKVHCQLRLPYVSFMGQTLDNHSYVDISQVGTSSSNSVQCRTNVSTCCTIAYGSHRGDWYFPNETRLTYRNVYEEHSYQRVDLRRSSGTDPTGIYCCIIDVNEYSVIKKRSVYVGLYTSGGGKVFHCGLALDVKQVVKLHIVK